MDCSLPGSSVHGILQARVLESGAIAFSTFRHDLTQISYTQWKDKQIQGIRSDRVPEELWMEVGNIVQEAVTKTIPKKKKHKKAKWLSEEALQIAEKRREAKGKGKQ